MQEVNAERVPVVNLEPFLEGTREGKEAVAQAIRRAAETVGFMYLSGHGVAQATIDAAFNASRQFFQLPEEEKIKVKVNDAHRGFIPMGNATIAGTTKPSANESFLAGVDLGPDDPDVKAGTPLHGPNRWPEALPSFRQNIEAYQQALTGLGGQLLRAFAIALDLEEEFFVPSFVKPMSFVRLLHYPPQPPNRADDEFGLAPHTDYGFATILAQDEVGGLQVRRRGGGWIDVPMIPGTFVVNIGDMLMRWTNDRWISNPHRVINTSGRERFSVPFFFDPTYRTNVECISTCQGPENPVKYGQVIWGEYLKNKFDTAYAYRRKA
ncbi:isopenicillin N synthase family dioxygenase [Variovorax sp. GB1R11]|uniref:isopenicillin N synthase family dioxygenase n=1 Tax=Variovorax sp. GB1R11 TaxID=3443741 RepID=UPI003F4756B8